MGFGGTKSSTSPKNKGCFFQNQKKKGKKDIDESNISRFITLKMLNITYTCQHNNLVTLFRNAILLI